MRIPRSRHRSRSPRRPEGSPSETKIRSPLRSSSRRSREVSPAPPLRSGSRRYCFRSSTVAKTRRSRILHSIRCRELSRRRRESRRRTRSGEEAPKGDTTELRRREMVIKMWRNGEMENRTCPACLKKGTKYNINEWCDDCKKLIDRKVNSREVYGHPLLRRPLSTPPVFFVDPAKNNGKSCYEWTDEKQQNSEVWIYGVLVKKRGVYVDGDQSGCGLDDGMKKLQN